MNGMVLRQAAELEKKIESKKVGQTDQIDNQNLSVPSDVIHQTNRYVALHY